MGESIKGAELLAEVTYMPSTNHSLHESTLTVFIIYTHICHTLRLIKVMQNRLGYECNPPAGSHRTDIVQAVKLGEKKKVRHPSTLIYT